MTSVGYQLRRWARLLRDRGLRDAHHGAAEIGIDGEQRLDDVLGQRQRDGARRDAELGGAPPTGRHRIDRPRGGRQIEMRIFESIQNFKIRMWWTSGTAPPGGGAPVVVDGIVKPQPSIV